MQDTRGVSATDPYALIRDWWGEGLTPQLVQRITAAPEEHLRVFQNAVLEVASLPLPCLSPLELRPVLALNTADSYRGRGRLRYLTTALRLLLYVDEVAVEDPLPFLLEHDGGDVLRALLLLKPLHDAGFVTFFRYSGRMRHPSHAQAFMSSVRGYHDNLPVSDPAVQEMIRLEGVARPYDFETLLFMSKNAVGLSLQLAAAAPDALHLFAGSAEEAVYLSLAIRAAGASTADLRSSQLAALASVDVPLLRTDRIPEVRLNTDEFSQWRHAIGMAIQRMGQISDEDDAWQQKAVAALQDELAPIRTRLTKSVARSPALSNAQSGVAALTYSGVGALAGAAAGGSLATALAGAAGAKGIEFGVRYLKSIRERRSNRALLDLVVSFY